MKEYQIKYFLNSKNGMTIISADVRDMISDYLDHYVSSGTETVSNEGMEILKEFIAFAALNFFSMERHFIVGWNLFLPELSMKFFVSIDVDDNTFVAKAGKYEPKENEQHRIMVVKYDQTTGIKTKSYIAVDYKNQMFDAIEIFFKEYIGASLIKKSSFYYLVQKADAESKTFFNTLSELKSGQFDFADFTEMNAVKLKFLCGCSHDRIKSMVASVGKEALDDLFTTESSVVVECPRCGLKFEFKKEDFEI